MKKLVLLILIAIASLTVFSQIGIQPKIDSSYIKLQKPIARLVVKDLLRYDSSLYVINSYKSDIDIFKKFLIDKDSLIYLKNEEISLYRIKSDNDNKIISLKDNQINLYKKETLNQHKTIVKQKRTIVFLEILSAILGTLSIGLAIKN